MKSFSDLVTNTQPYVHAILNEMRDAITGSKGDWREKAVLDLGAGDPDISAPSEYYGKFGDYIWQPTSNRYPGYKAISEFAEGIMHWYKTRFEVYLEENELTPLLGGKDGITHIPPVFLNPLEIVLAPDPGYGSFREAAPYFTGTVISYPLVEDERAPIDLDRLSYGSSTKFIYVNFPSNPTGQVVDLEFIERLVDWAKRTGIWIVYDNPYSEITFDGYRAPSFLQVKGAKDVGIEIGSASKTLAMQGWRIGWAVGNKEVIAALAKVKSIFDSGLARVWQQIAGWALLNFGELHATSQVNWYGNMIATYESRRDTLLTLLPHVGLTAQRPKGAFYLWAKIPDTFSGSWNYCKWILQEKHILVTPGVAYGSSGDRHVRLSFCRKIDNAEDFFRYGKIIC